MDIIKQDRHVSTPEVDDRYMSFHNHSDETIFTIHADGRVVVNPKYSVDAAAQEFWSAVRRIFPSPVK